MRVCVCVSECWFVCVSVCGVIQLILIFIIVTFLISLQLVSIPIKNGNVARDDYSLDQVFARCLHRFTEQFYSLHMGCLRYITRWQHLCTE